MHANRARPDRRMLLAGVSTGLAGLGLASVVDGAP
jgi:hypothetical protein